MSGYQYFRNMIKKVLIGSGLGKYVLAPDFHRALINIYNKKKGGFFFLQVGANDGVSNDPIHQFVREYRPAGVLLEPQPDAFERLQSTYPKKDFPSLKLINTALATETNNIVMYRIARNFEETYKKQYKQTANASGITSMNQEHVRQFLLKVMPDFFRVNDVESCIEEIRVPAISFDELRERENIKYINFIQVDTEGFDANIVNIILSSQLKYMPALIRFESKNISSEEKNSLFQRLRELGYSLHHTKGDTIAFRKLY